MTDVSHGRRAGVALAALLVGATTGCGRTTAAGPGADGSGDSWRDYLMPRVGFACSVAGPRYGGRPGDGYVISTRSTTTLTRQVASADGTAYTLHTVGRVVTDDRHATATPGPSTHTDRLDTTESDRVDRVGALHLGTTLTVGTATVTVGSGGVVVPAVARLGSAPTTSTEQLVMSAPPGLAGAFETLTTDGSGRIRGTVDYSATGRRVAHLTVPGLGELRDLVRVTYRTTAIRFAGVTAEAGRELAGISSAARRSTTEVWFARGLGRVQTVVTGGALASTSRADHCG